MPKAFPEWVESVSSRRTPDAPIKSFLEIEWTGLIPHIPTPGMFTGDLAQHDRILRLRGLTSLRMTMHQCGALAQVDSPGIDVPGLRSAASGEKMRSGQGM